MKNKQNRKAKPKGPGLVVLVAVILLLAVAPYFRGLFFRFDQMIAAAVVSAGFVVWSWLYGRRGVGSPSLAGRGLDALVMALPLVFWLAVLVAVNPTEAIVEAVNFSVLAMIYYAVSRTVVSAKEKYLLLAGMLGVGALVSLVGLVSAGLGLDLIKGNVASDRLSSALQYPNSLAAFLGATVLIGLPLVPVANPKLRPVFVTLIAVAVTGLAFTLSRGAWALFPFFLGLTFFWSGGSELRPARSAVLAVLAAALAVFPFSKDGIQVGRTWVMTAGLAGAAAALATYYLVETLSVRLSGVDRRLRAAGWAGLGMGFLAAGWGMKGWLLSVLGRLTTISLADVSVRGRLDFVLDGLKMVSERPVLGFGGGGWASAYRAFQSYGYVAREVHNEFVQTWVETGTIGLLVFLGVWVSLAVLAFSRIRASGGSDRALVIAAAIPALWVGAHSLGDVNLSLLAFAFWVWTLMGVVRGAEPETGEGNQPVRVIPGLLVLVISMALALSYRSAAEGTRAYIAGNAPRAVEHFRRATALNPFNGSARADLGQALLAQASRQPGSAGKEEGLAHLARAARLEPYNSTLALARGRQLFALAYRKEGLQELERARRLDHFSPAKYEALAEARLVTGIESLESGDQVLARENLEAVLAVTRDMAETSSRAAQIGDRGVLPMPSSTEVLDLSAGRAAAVLSKWSQAEVYLTSAAKQSNLRATANLWLAAVKAKVGKTAESKAAPDHVSALVGRIGP